MKIAIFYPRNTLASWYTLGGYAKALRELGHDVIDCPLPGNHVFVTAELRDSLPSIDDLKKCDCILLTFAEYVTPWLKDIYDLGAWKKMKTPKVARFDESFDRPDLGLHLRWPDMKEWADYFSFPAVQDAKRYKGEFFPFAADATMFKPYSTFGALGIKPIEKKYPVGFIGSMYPLRKQYAQNLLGYMKDLPFHTAHVGIIDLSGMPAVGYEKMQTQLLAQNYAQIKVFFCLPPMSQLVVCKVFEAMACGTMVMYPRLEGDGRENLKVLADGKEVIYYTMDDFEANAEVIRHYVEHDDEREAIALAGHNRVIKDYTLDKLMNHLLSPVTSLVA